MKVIVFLGEQFTTKTLWPCGAFDSPDAFVGLPQLFPHSVAPSLCPMNSEGLAGYEELSVFYYLHGSKRHEDLLPIFCCSS